MSHFSKDWASRLEFVGPAVVQEGYHIWGTSPIESDDGTIHLFIARWPVSAAFDPGWRRASEIARYYGSNPEGPFTFGEVVLTGTGSGTWDSCAPHNPTIKKIGNTYALIYIANDGINHRGSQCVGMATATDPVGPWTKVNGDGIILSPPSNPENWCYGSLVGVTNPTLVTHPDGRYFLYFKAKVKGDVHRMGVAISDSLEGPYVFHNDPISDNEQMIEDGYGFVKDDRIYLLTTDCSDQKGLLWSSADGLNFSSPDLGFGKINAYISEQVLQEAPNHRNKNLVRPQLLIQGDTPTYLYVASGVNILAGDGSCSYVLKVGSKAEGYDEIF